MGVGFSFRPLIGRSTVGDDKHAPERFLLLREGDIGWADLAGVELDKRAVDAIFAKFKEMGNEVVVDYHHQTMKTDDGIKAPAAGWIRRLEFVSGEGLWAEDVEWTDEARAEIEAGKFKYISPVIFIDKKTKQIEELLNASLTNVPRTKEAQQLLEAASLWTKRRDTMATATKTRKGKKKIAVSAQEVLEVNTDALEEPEAEELNEVDAAIAAIAEALTAAGAEVPEDAVGILAMAVEFIAGAAATEESEENEESSEENKFRAEDDKASTEQRVEEAASTLSKKLGLKGKGIRALTAEVAAVQIKASAVDGLSARLRVLEAERKKSRVESLVEEQIGANKLHPDNKEAVAAARRLAETVDEQQFKEVYASMPGIDPGQQTNAADSPKGSRLALIAASRKEWETDFQGEKAGTPVDCYTNVFLDDHDKKRLTTVEAEQLKKEVQRG